MTLELYTLYVDGKQRALMMGKDAEHCVTMYREASLGQGIKPESVTAVRSRETPFEDFVRLAFEGLYMQIFQAQMMARGPHTH